MVLIFYTGNSDSPLSNFLSNNRPNNWFGIYNRATADQGFQFFAHDAEHTLGTSGSRDDRTGPFDIASGSENERTLAYSNPQFLHQHLMNHEAYRLKFADRAQRLLLADGVLSAAASAARYAERIEQVAPAILAESARWGDSKRPDNPYSIPDWEAQVDEVFGFFSGRSEVVIEQLREDALFPDVQAPIFNSTGGVVAAGFPLMIVNANGGGEVFYTTDGSDPRRGDGSLDPAALRYAGVTSQTTLLPAGSTWRYLDDASEPSAAWLSAEYDDQTWASGPAQLGYGDGDETTLVNFVDIDPVTSGIQKNPTTYFRSKFVVSAVDSIVNLTLRLLRDDGAAVYINGQEVVRSNLPGAVGTPLGNQQFALSVVGGNAESTFLPFTVPAAMLVDGENTIAVEIHQVSPTSSDVSFDLELLANRVFPPIPISQSSTIKARVRENEVWSALAEATFIIDVEPATAANLRITEINYHPAPPTAAERAISPTIDEDDFEFVELRNFGERRIDLAGVQFVQVADEGLAFDFTTAAISVLEPGQSLLVVEDAMGFAVRYGSNLPIAGQWSGKLSDGGELLTVRDAGGNLIHSFSYDDEVGWPTAPDGNGPTLVVRNPFGDYNTPTNWRASFGLLGTPGVFERVPADFDTDGDTDGDDFLLWQAGYGLFTGDATLADGDADADGFVDGDDFLLWQANYVGDSATAGAAGGRRDDSPRELRRRLPGGEIQTAKRFPANRNQGDSTPREKDMLDRERRVGDRKPSRG